MSLEDVAAQPRQPRPFPNTPHNVLDQFSMKGKVIAITGASDGIGFAAAEAMAEAGGDVALIYHSNPAAHEKAKRLTAQHGIRAASYHLDVSDPAQVEKAIGRIAGDFGRLDVFVANSGAAISKPVLEMSVEEYRRLVSVNCKSVSHR